MFLACMTFNQIIASRYQPKTHVRSTEKFTQLNTVLPKKPDVEPNWALI